MVTATMADLLDSRREDSCTIQRIRPAVVGALDRNEQFVDIKTECAVTYPLRQCLCWMAWVDIRWSMFFKFLRGRRSRLSKVIGWS